MAREHKEAKEKRHSCASSKQKSGRKNNGKHKSDVPGVPPTDNLRRHPDEAYGDTEISQRGQVLDKIKKESS
jgi:hypothetical protein